MFLAVSRWCWVVLDGLGGFRRFLDGFDSFQVVFGRLDAFSYDFPIFPHFLFVFLHSAPPARAGLVNELPVSF